MELTEHRPPEAANAAAPKIGPRRWVWVFGALGLGLLLGGCALWAWPETSVQLESTPAGAEVAIDGHLAGRTPLRLSSRPWPLGGQLEISLAGYRSWAGQLVSNPGQASRLEVSLDPLPGRLSISSSPAGATVRLDGQDVGQTPLALSDLAPGHHPLQLGLADYQAWESDLEIEPGGSLSREVSLRPVATPPPATPLTQAVGEPGVPGSQPGQSASAALTEAVAAATPTPIYPIAIMIENAPDARPQSGLESADIVYEAMAEGGISRFMAVFVDHDAAVVGPVRSARHYFVNLAAEFGASVVHVGASPLGYVSLTWYGLRDLDETFGHPGFWRSRTRAAPHNAYTSLAAAREALDGRVTPALGGWGGLTFKEGEQRRPGVSAPKLSLDYQPWGYQVEYRYDEATNRYLRFMEGAAHRDAESQAQLTAANVAVLRLETWVIDDAGRLDMTQVGSGAAAYFLDGVVVEGTWSKPKTNAPTRFLDTAGNPVALNPGPTWIQLISQDGKVSY